MKNMGLKKKELEQLCAKEKIVLQRYDPMTQSNFYMPNFEKIGIMIREFDFLVEGASRGKAINEISKIELYLHENEDNRNAQSRILAENYSKVSIFVEMKRELIDDRKSENWNYLFTKYFSIEDIYNYFHKTESSSSFFKKFKIFSELVELDYNLKLMDYLQSQVQLFLPREDDLEIPYNINSIELVLTVLHNTGFLDIVKNNMKDSYYYTGAKFITSLLNASPQMWKKISNFMNDLDNNFQESVLENNSVNQGLKDILFNYKIDLRKKI